MLKNRPYLNWILLCTFIVAGVLSAHLSFSFQIESLFLTLRTTVVQPVLVGLVTVAGLSLDILLPIPSSLLSVWSVVAMGFPGGVITIWIGMSLACIVGYWLGFGSNAWLIRRFIRTQDINSVQQLSERYGIAALVLLRAVPILAETSVIAAGLVQMPFRRFLWITSLSNAGIAAVYAGLGGYASVNHSYIAAFFAGVFPPAAAWLVYRAARAVKGRQSLSGLYSAKDLLKAKFSVPFAYPVLFTDDVFSLNNRTLVSQIGPTTKTRQVKALIVIDSGVVSATPALQKKIFNYCASHAIDMGDQLVDLPGGEAAKSQYNIDCLQRCMLDRRLDRQSYVIAVGGGAVLDAVGYAAATFHRGIRLIRVPTTVLSQNDAGIGVKNGINSYGLKNLLGCFAVPYAVINDQQFLATLKDRDFRSGFAEAIKVALIRDARFYNWITENVEKLRQRDMPTVEMLIKSCAALHINQICHGGDPFELGSARPLDYGHWSAHKLESLSNHQLSHGEAVAIGMVLDAFYAVEIGLLAETTAISLMRPLQALGFKVWDENLFLDLPGGEWALMAGLEEFRQHLGGELCIVLLTEIGKSVEVNTINTEAMKTACGKLVTIASQSTKWQRQHKGVGISDIKPC